MSAVVPIALVLIILIPVAGIVIGARRRKKVVAGLSQTAAYAKQRGWQRTEPDRQITQRSLLLYQATGSAVLNIQIQFAGQHRGLAFQAAQVARPPSPQRPTAQWISVVYVPRPVPGPRLQLAEQKLSTATFLQRDTQIGDPAFDAAFHVSAEDANFARTVLHAGLTGALTQDARAQQSVVAFEQQHLFALQHGELTPHNLQAMLDLLVDIHSSVPWQSVGSPGQF
ncbi:hypothetical protein DVA86_05975 [Streptomyces armeniacus]|uniref:Uncharacterized protein n=1 Tax=Streptomyces armeniacus TaxID=83291 RepID=A0A345XKV4_9ACTN|nr:hypothetical protein [Streptomyces armeniacus]AXK32270.1 hypothetical protein DVA86_05975 [Streptomyces armeniacus]